MPDGFWRGAFWYVLGLMLFLGLIVGALLLIGSASS
jgi:hypothetical protein